jgi:tight adherence protein B
MADIPNISDGLFIFLAMVFVAVFLLSQGLVVPVFGEGNKMRKRLKQRLAEIDESEGEDTIGSLLREKYLHSLTPLERMLESLPLMENLRRTIEQAGWTVLAYRLVLLSFVLAIVGAFFGWTLTRMPIAALGGAVIGFAIPLLRVWSARRDRLMKFEEQLPDAIDSMKRALKAGHPFSATLKLVAEDMEDPIAREFELTFADVNYGNDLRRAMLGLLQRVPSLTVMALVTSVLVQKETGGNLAEILEQISKVIRGRFRFQRRVKTLSAEGRLSAWILALVPLVLFAVITVTTPAYLPVLLDDPVGKKLIVGGAILAVIGIAWVRRIIRIDV